jgi:hypothetical protein
MPAPRSCEYFATNHSFRAKIGSTAAKPRNGLDFALFMARRVSRPGESDQVSTLGEIV